ncbi:MAG: PspC domain-containing protein [Thermoleophilia bacterium]|nr:PspC domain-containing protein [Thermoleophilia bacterium]MDH4345651.1 PspC domain-containing protein [Thermoleophilia bacterium]
MSTIAGERGRWAVPAPRPEQRVVAGVAAGIAASLGVDPGVVRVAFVVLAAGGGLGVLLYLLAWAVMATAGTPVAPPTDGLVDGLGPIERVLGVALLTVGLLLLVQALDLGFGRSTVWPVVLLGLGLLLAWHRRRLGSIVDGRSAAVRVVAGLVVAGTGLAGLVVFNLDIAAARDTLLVLAAVVGGVALVVAPAITGLARELADERRQRIRTEERGRMAAHLHDSVLQTLALIQRDADEPGRTRALARGQERELRAWLYGGDDDAGVGTVRAGLEQVCAEVEQLHDVPVELVAVGAELPVDERLRQVLAATREAIVNAAKHSSAARVDVFAEVEEGVLEVFVRDTGVGFDPGAVAADRRGLRESVVARLQRVGGSATVTSAPGQGTEVELRVPLEAR